MISLPASSNFCSIDWRGSLGGWFRYYSRGSPEVDKVGRGYSDMLVFSGTVTIKEDLMRIYWDQAAHLTSHDTCVNCLHQLMCNISESCLQKTLISNIILNYHQDGSYTGDTVCVYRINWEEHTPDKSQMIITLLLSQPWCSTVLPLHIRSICLPQTPAVQLPLLSESWSDFHPPFSHFTANHVLLGGEEVSCSAESHEMRSEVNLKVME